MASLGILKKAIDVLTVMNVAVTNIRLYPPTSAIIRNTVDRAYQIFLEIVKEEESLIFAESGNNFIICSRLFDEEDQKKYPQALGFLELLAQFSLNSLAFERGLEKTDLDIFLKTISRSRQDIQDAGGLKKVVEDENLSHIVMDHKVYIVVDQYQKFVASIDIKDTAIIKYFTGENALSTVDIQKIKEMAKDPAWINQVFQTGMNYIMKQRGEKNYEKLSEIVVHMINTLDEVCDIESKEKISKMLASSIVEIDESMLAMILMQDIEGAFGKELLTHVIEELNDIQFERVAAKVKRTGREISGDETLPLAYNQMMQSEKGKRLQEQINSRSALEKSQKEQQLVQLKTGINNIFKDEYLPLLNLEFTELLPEYLEHLLESGNEKNAETIILKLSQTLASTSIKVRTGASYVLAHVCKILLAQSQYDLMVRMCPHWLHWLQIETELSPSCERICIQIHELTRHLILSSQFMNAFPIVDTFNQLHQKKIGKCPELAKLSGNMLKGIASEDVLMRLLKEIHTKNGHHKKAVQILLQLGGASLEGLLDILQKSRNMPERVRILRIICEIGEPAPQALIRKMEAGGPWYYMRNLILVMGKIGKQEHLEHLTPFLGHEDFRVQRETLNTIFNIGGKDIGEILVSALSMADERLVPNIVDMLGALRYKSAVSPLLELLESQPLFSPKTSDKLREKICVTLGRIGSETSINALRKIAGQKNLLGITHYPENVRAAAEQALFRIHRSQPEEIKGELFQKKDKNKIPGITEPTDLIAKQNDDTVEETIINMLLEGISAYAKERRFEEAEALRQKLIELDSMAFSEIIRADEIIEKEKHEALDMDRDHLGIWPDLYDPLTPEEANALYYAMEEAIYEMDEAIFTQGQYNNHLYFIHRGQLKQVFSIGERENLLKVLGAGDIVGEDAFFSISVSTTSMVTLSQVELSYLDKKILEDWKTTFPALESKLHDYCLRMDRVRDILENKGMDRRVHKRINIIGTISIDLLNPSGSPTGKRFKGSFLDISAGGVSFMIKSSSRKNVSLLLGRKLNMTFDFPMSLCKKIDIEISENAPRKLKLSQTGTVIGVSHRQDEDYSVHVKFDNLLGTLIAGLLEK